MPVQIDGRGGYDSFALTSRPTGVMLLTRRQPFYPSAAHDKFFSICTAFSGYTEFGIAPQDGNKLDQASTFFRTPVFCAWISASDTGHAALQDFSGGRCDAAAGVRHAGLQHFLFHTVFPYFFLPSR